MTASLAARVLVRPLRFYQRFISPALPASCRYEPSCSSYALDALLLHGAWRGGWMAIRRIGRCHPWHEGGYDPVPPVRERHSPSGSSVGVNPGASPAERCVESARGPEVNTSQSVVLPNRAKELAAPSVVPNTDALSALAEPPTPRSNAA